MADGQSWNQARDAYDSIASAYEDFTHPYMYERWTGRLLGKAEEVGVSGIRLLDVGCGSGLSFVALLDRGWRVTGCDISPEMLKLARSRVGDRAELREADMRRLPHLGSFDLVWSLNDSFNYLLSEKELEATLRGMRGNLAAEGIVLFDVNSLAGYSAFWSGETVREHNGRTMLWQGQATATEVVAGGFYEARFEVVGEPGSEHVHRQRHFPRSQVEAAIEAAGLRCVAVFGDLDGELHPDLDEDVHTKAVYLCTL